ncbi:MAG: molybdenum cofactor biosynthesis protein MoaE [Terriglobales bacterium]
MRVHVLFFGPIADQLRRREDRLELPAGAIAADVHAHYRALLPALGALGAQVQVAVNQEFCSPAIELHDEDEVALLPPMSGGSEAAPPRAVIAELVRVPIDREALQARLKAPADGAVVLFDGVVRNHSVHQGRSLRTQHLEYEAYEPMALKRMRAIGEEVLRRWPVDSIALVHRLGRLEIGESSVVIVVTSAHRQPAFEACRWAIDTLKNSVPIWKREHAADGTVWVEGEFPAESAGK